MEDNSPRRPRDESANEPAIDWRRVLAEHDRWLRTIIHARLRDPDAVDEVMQEVSLAAVRQAAPIQDPAKVAPWLYRLAIRRVLHYRRKLGRQRKLTDRFVARNTPTDYDSRNVDPLDWLICVERSQRVRQAMAELAPRDAEILLLKYSENWSYHEIAHHLGVSHSAVEARLHRARKRLKEHLLALDVVEVSQ
jgi:RNA polymerase sigma factor (sigma-70 family)